MPEPSTEPYDYNGPRGYLSTTVIPDQFTRVGVLDGEVTVVEVGGVGIVVTEAVLDRLDQAILDARAALASRLAAAVSPDPRRPRRQPPDQGPAAARRRTQRASHRHRRRRRALRLRAPGGSLVNREQMVEAAARVMAGLEPGEEWPTNAALGGGYTGTRDDEYRDGLRDQAREVLDAILPQVTTVSELEALPKGVKVLDGRGYVHQIDHLWKHHMAGYVANDTADLVRHLQPLVVIWQPEVTS